MAQIAFYTKGTLWSKSQSLLTEKNQHQVIITHDLVEQTFKRGWRLGWTSHHSIIIIFLYRLRLGYIHIYISIYPYMYISPYTYTNLQKWLKTWLDRSRRKLSLLKILVLCVWTKLCHLFLFSICNLEELLNVLRTWNHIKENMLREESEISPKERSNFKFLLYGLIVQQSSLIWLDVQQRERINAVLQQLRVGWTSCGLEEIRIIEWNLGNLLLPHHHHHRHIVKETKYDMVEEKTIWAKDVWVGQRYSVEGRWMENVRFHWVKNLTLQKNSKGNGKGINDHLGALAYSKLISGQ